VGLRYGSSLSGRISRHYVTLFEKDRLGGQLLLAAETPQKQRVSDYTEYLIRQMNEMPLKLELGKEVISRGLYPVSNPMLLYLPLELNP
jgi:hypothetical protein